MKKFLCVLAVCLIGASTAALCSGCSDDGESGNSASGGYVVETTVPDLQSSEFGFFILDDNKLMVTEYTGDEKDIVIPESYQGYTITAIGEFFFFKSDITSVVIPDTVTEIQKDAFANCRSLKSVTLSKNLETIGNFAFYYTSSLESIEIPASVKSIGDYAFSASGIKSLTIDDETSLTSLGNLQFFQCPNLAEAYIPEAIESIDEETFSENGTSLTIVSSEGSAAEKFVETNSSNENYSNGLSFKTKE